VGTCIEIIDWDKHYEINRTRELKKMSWVPIPNKLDGDGYTLLVEHPNGAAHFGAWIALVEVASRCDKRGTLMRDNRTPHDIASLQRITRIPVKIWQEALPRLVSIGWIKGYIIPQEGAVKPQGGAEIPRYIHTDKQEGREAPQEGAAHQAPPISATPSEPQEKGLSTKVDNRIPEESTPMMFELQEIYRKTTHGETLKLSDDEMSSLLELYRRHDGPSVVAAYRLHQAKKPGKAFEYFLQDFGEYIAKAPKPAAPPPLHCEHCGADVGANGKGHTATCNRPGNPNGLAPPAPPDDFDDDFPEAT
jgi:hypothetical protein